LIMTPGLPPRALLSCAAILIACAALASKPAAAAADESPAVSPQTPAAATTQASDKSRWQSYITPYLWLPTIKGQLNFMIPDGMGNTFGLTVVPSQYTPKLASALMFTAGVRKGNWGAATDLIYMNLTAVTNGVTTITGPGGNLMIPINTNVQTRFSSAIWTAGATYNLLPGPPGNLDGVLGFRYATVNPKLSWNFSGPIGAFPIAGSQSVNVNLWDGIVGVKGKFDFHDGHWFAPFYADIGTGGAQFTWQAAGGIGYATHSGAWNLSYRNLYYDMGSNGLMHKINFGGPLIGYTFKF
jgi:hypothetical protein